MTYIVIDGGTTNTRINLVTDNAVIDTVKLNQGARSAIDAKESLASAISRAISDILTRNGVKVSAVKRILASGMITSEFGLYKVDHIVAPAGIPELHSGMKEVVLHEISPIPFVFVSGVKTAPVSLEAADMMRGEETELMGILNATNEESVYILPGSHSKIIFTDAKGKIVNFYTMLTGEMLASLSQNTILKDAVDLYGGNTDSEYLVKGYEYALANGLNEALFKTRILKNLFGANTDQTYSFFSGAVLSGEVKKILSLGAKSIYIAGRSEIKEQLRILISTDKTVSVIEIDDKTAAQATVNGILKIYEYTEN